MPARLKLLWRLLQIESTLARYGLDGYLWQLGPLRRVAWLRYIRFWRRPPKQPLAARLRLAIESLGPIFVKFGQAVSVRRDLLPDDIATELARLQDDVAPFPGEISVTRIEGIFGKPIGEVFESFDSQPLAAASIAQVHTATLVDGSRVVVKLLRPNIRALIRRDIEAMQALAKLIHDHVAEASRLRPMEIVEEFEKTLSHELDLLREAANAAQLKRNFADSSLLYVPEVYWDYCRSDVLTLERIDAVPISDIETLRDAGTNFKKLAENGVEIFFTQVFRHNFFHADMHPGNIFVDITDPENPRYVAVDFGIVGTLHPEDQRYLAENFLAFFKRDYHRVAALHIDSGWVPADTRIDEFEAAVRAVCEPVFNKPLSEISFGLVLLRLFSTARAFRMQVQPQLVLLQKTLLAIEGLGRELYPDLDLWQNAYPILEQWVRQRKDPRYVARKLIEAWPDVSEDLLYLPKILRAQVERARAETAATAAHAANIRNTAVPTPTNSVADYWPATVILIAGVLWMGLDIQPVLPGTFAVTLGFLWLLLRTVNSTRRS